MDVSKEEILHISKLASLKLEDDQIQEYVKNLQDILNFANIVDKAPIDGLDISVSGGINNYNIFRKDEINVFENNQALLDNAPEKQDNMFKIPKVI